MHGFEQWKAHHAELPPLSDYLFKVLNERWVRFHALPEIKRYATNEHERNIIRTRAQTLGNAVLGDRQPCLVVTVFRGWHRSPRPYSETLIEEFELRFWLDWAYVDRFGDYEGFGFYGNRLNWEYQRFRQTLDDTAENEAEVLFMNCLTGSIFAPYDGGFDCFLPTPEEMQKLKAAHKDWLSPLPSGL